MNIALRFYRLMTTQVNFAPLIIFFKKLVARLPRLMDSEDDPAALRYIFDKYNGEID